MASWLGLHRRRWGTSLTLLRRHGTLSDVMDIILLLFLIPLIVGVLLVLFVFLRKIPTVRVMNVESHPEQKARRTKDLLILQRLSKGRLGVLVRLGQGVTRAIRDGRRFGRRRSEEHTSELQS